MKCEGCNGKVESTLKDQVILEKLESGQRVRRVYCCDECLLASLIQERH